MEITFENLEAIFENATESIILLDKEYKVIGYNKVAKQRLLYTIQKEIYKGADFRDYLYLGKEKLFSELFTNALQGKIQESETYAKSIAGEDIWFRSKLFPVYNKAGVLMGIALFALNVSDRKIAEIALQESEEKFRKIMESAPTPIIALDRNLKIALLNKETEKAFGYSQEQLHGKDIGLIVPGKNELFESIAKGEQTDLLPLKLDRSNHIQGIKRDGRKIDLELNVNTFIVKNENFIILIISDVTEQIIAEQKILNQYYLLQDIARQQSHEVRRPVANILGIVNIFRTIKGLTEEEKDLYINCLYKATSELDEIIRKIILYASDIEGKEK